MIVRNVELLKVENQNDLENLKNENNMILTAKAKTLKSEWIFGYPIKENDKFFIINDDSKIEIIEETICYHLGAFDKNNKPVYTNDIIDDFAGGVLVPDPKSINKDFPDYKRVGNTERLGEVVIEDGTVRIRTKVVDYCFNISNGYKLSDTEVKFNAFDNY